jgi:diguanylate cyclase (GGDEF)-like protein
VAPSYHVRLALANVLAGFLFAMHAALVLRQGSPTFAKILAASVLALMAAIQLMRLVSSFIWPVGNDIFETAPQHLFYVASLVFCILLFSISTVLMATDRLRGRLEHLATHDSLTNALTRRHMDEACQQELERCRRHDRSMALLMMDLDHFKAINDTYGHQTGDQVLINFVARVNALLRRPDQLGRFGGEEFIALLPETSLEEALAVAGRIREACAVTSQGPSSTVTIGVTTNHTDTDTVEKMLGRADTAMYRAKDKGRNRVEAS